MTGEAPADGTAAPVIPEHVPVSGREVLARALASRPEDRWPSMDAFAAALLAVEVKDETGPRRFARAKRSPTPYGWTSHAVRGVEVAPDIGRAEYRLADVAAEVDVTPYQRASGFSDVAFYVWSRTDRLGPPSDAMCFARASEVVALMHGWGMTRSSWNRLAMALCRDNPRTVVIAPDVGGFGYCRFPRGTLPEVNPERVYRSMVTLLGVLNLRRLPTVIVGHSMSALSLLVSEDIVGDTGERAPYRVALAPVAPWAHASMRRRFLTGAAALFVLGRIPAARRRLATTTSLLKAAVSLTAADRTRYVNTLVSAEPRILRQIATSTAAAKPPIGREHLGRCMAIAGTRDPQMTADDFRDAIASVGLVPGNIRVIKSATHFPFLDNRSRPEDTARNVAEIVDSIGEMLIAAKDGTRLTPTPEPPSNTGTVTHASDASG